MSNFKCDKCGMTDVDCGLGIFKTPREIEIEKLVKELKEENERLKGWREISHKKINELSDRVKNYIKCTNALTCEINDLKEENNHLTDVNKMVKQKLQIAEEALDYYAELYIDTDVCDDQFFGADAVEALQNMKEVKK